MPDQFEDFQDHREEEVRLAELVCKHKEIKLFEQWLQIAYALDTLEDIAAGRATIDRDEEPDYGKDRSFQYQMDIIKRSHPVLFEFPAVTKRHLAWLAKQASRVSYRYKELPVEQRSKLTSPSIIRSRYEKDQTPSA